MVAAGMAGLLLLALVALWALTPLLLPGLLEQRAGAALGREVRVQSARLQPWRLAVALQGLSVAGAGAAPPALVVEQARLQLAPSSLWRGAPVIARLELDRPLLRIGHTAQGWDFDDLLQRLRAAPRTEGPPARWWLGELRLHDGRIAFDDSAPDRRAVLEAISLQVDGLGTLAPQTPARIALSARAGAAALSAKGTVQAFSPTPNADLTLTLGPLSIADWLAFLPPDLPLQPVQGRLQSEARVRLRWGAGQPLQAQADGRLQADAVELRDRQGPPVRWQALVLPLARLDTAQRQLALGTVQLSGLQAGLVRDARGRWRWPGAGAGAGADADADAGADAGAPGTPGAAAPPPWSFSGEGVQLTQARLTFDDRTRQPLAAAALAIEQAEADAWRWPSPTAVRLKAQAGLQVQGRPAGQLRLEGEAAPQAGRLRLSLQDLSLAALAPWRPAGLAAVLEGRGAGQGELQWNGDAWQLAVPRVALSALRWLPPLPGETAPSRTGANRRDAPQQIGWRSLALEGLRVDGAQRRIELRRLLLDTPVAAALRERDGTMAWAGALASLQPGGPTPPASAPAAAAAAPPWQLVVEEARLDHGRLHWTDLSPGVVPRPAQRNLRSQVDELQVQLRGLRWPMADDAPPLAWQVAGRFDDGRGTAGGRLQAGGQWTSGGPRRAARLAGQWQVERLPLHGWDRYLAQQPGVSLQRLLVGGRGRFDLGLAPAGLRLSSEGELVLGELQLFAAEGQQAPGELLAFGALRLPQLRVDLAPGRTPQVGIGEAMLTDLRTRLVVSEQGRFNLVDAAAPAGAASAPPGGFGPAPAADPAPPRPATAEVRSAAAQALSLSVGGLTLDQGRIDFTDRFVRPNYSAVLSDLQGRLGAFGTGPRAPATLALSGRIAGTGELKVEGRLNPAVSPPALDITAQAREIELAPLTPYAAKYIGYEIERGKLAMQVRYQITDDGRLEAANQVTFNRLEFGAQVDSPQATGLPVRLAVALLTDREGRMTLDLPVSGSLGDPQFSVGRLVLQAFGNLIGKALTSPFALLGALGGDAPGEQARVAFLPGQTVLAPDSAARLDRLVQALREKPAVTLSIAGAADGQAEREALQSALLEQRLADEARRRSAQAGNPPPLAPGSEERLRLLRALYRANPPPGAPTTVLGRPSDLPPGQLEAAVRSRIPVDDNTVRELALARGLAVREALAARGLDSARLYLAAPRWHGVGAAEAGTPAAAASAPSDTETGPAALLSVSPR